MFDDLFDSEVELQEKQFSFPPSSVSVTLLAVPRDNQHIDKWVPLVVWHAAEETCRAILSTHSDMFKNRSVVELGAGTGLSGLVASIVSSSGNCLLTDGERISVDALERSIRLNHLEHRVHAALHSWGDVNGCLALIQQFRGPFEVCLATDLIYEAGAIGPLLVSANTLLLPGGCLFLSNHKFRFQRLAEAIDQALISVPALSLTQTFKLNDVDVYVFHKSA